MCCPLDNYKGEIVIKNFTIDEKNNKKIINLDGVYDRTPRTFSDRISRFFQRLELLEKIAEIADESFHLLGSTLQKHTSTTVFHALYNLHDSAHNIEHFLHSFCSLGDLSRLVSGKFLEYQDKERKRLDYLRSLSRVFHAVSNLLFTASFLTELKICQLNPFQNILKSASLFSALGYAIQTISVIRLSQKRKSDDQLVSDLGIHMAGCLFNVIPLIKKSQLFISFVSPLNKIAAIAGIIHAGCVVQRLLPKDQEEFSKEFEICDNIIKDHPHQHGADHRCYHEAGV